MFADLSKKSVRVESVAKKAFKEKEVLGELLEALTSRRETIRFNSFKILLFVSEKYPKVLYPRWDFFAEFLSSDNTYHKYIAIYIIANLTKIDAKNKFEKAFSTYCNLLDDKSIIPAAYVAGNSGKIARTKPKLLTKITNRLLNIHKTRHAPERRDLIKGYAIESFNQYFEEARNKKRILEFVGNQLGSKSPRTKKVAQKFLKRWGK